MVLGFQGEKKRKRKKEEEEDNDDLRSFSLHSEENEPDSDNPWAKAWLYHLLDDRSWTSYLTSVDVSFLIFKNTPYH